MSSIDRRVYTNVLLMLQARGYLVPSALYDRFDTDNESNDWGRLPILYKPDETGVLVFFPGVESGSVGKKRVDRYIDIVSALNLLGYNIQKCIVVYKDKMTPYANSISSSGLFENFKEDFFYRNLPEHVDIPKHILLTPEERDAIRNPDTLPEICITDPNSRYHAAKIGDIFKIIRKSTTSGYPVVYRVVTNVL